MNSGRTKMKVDFNSPVILGFTALCTLALILQAFTGGWTTDMFFSVYRSSLFSPFTYIRFLGHIFGHADWSHYIGNMMLILIIGPLLEEKYGTYNIAVVIFITALITGLVNYILFPRVQLLGASGVVFAFILLSSFTRIREGKIPLTFILVGVIYLGQQVLEGILIQDNISNITHIVGGMTGAYLGYVMNIRGKNPY
ncbi:rhomboid family intramembrane serine protease [Filifactor villosus]|uniref:Rhomboid family intramembrane serine protease n=1 Tax=Filifactor villosus TaxID=29374 RepID=A0ABV9QIE2_9FIRM